MSYVPEEYKEQWSVIEEKRRFIPRRMLQLKKGHSYGTLPRHRHWLIDTYKLPIEKWIPERFVVKATRSPEEAIRTEYSLDYAVSAPITDARFLTRCLEKRRLDPLVLCTCNEFFERPEAITSQLSVKGRYVANQFNKCTTSEMHK